MSACTYSESVDRESDTAFPASTDDAEFTTTLAPRSASRRAVASPIPLDDPVTIATLPSSASMVFSSVCRRRAYAEDPTPRCRLSRCMSSWRRID